MTRIATFVIFFLAIAAAVGCKDDGTGTIEGVFTVSDCGLDNREVNLSADYFTASYFENTLTIRLQHTTQNYIFADGLLLEIRDVDAAAAALGEPIVITLVPSLADFKESGPTETSGNESGFPTTPYNSKAGATLYLNDTCPDSTVSFADGEGTITFSHIYKPGGAERIAGTFSLEFIDPRTWSSSEDYGATARISGEFDFDY